MLTFARAGILAAALLALAAVSAPAADKTPEKAFSRQELNESAIKLEDQIKTDAATPTPPSRKTISAAA